MEFMHSGQATWRQSGTRGSRTGSKVAVVWFLSLCPGCPDLLPNIGGINPPTGGPDQGAPACSTRQQPQVVIEARFITTQSNFLKEIGIDLPLMLSMETGMLSMETGQADTSSFSPTFPTQDPVQAFSSILSGCEDVKLNPFALASLPAPANESGLDSVVLAGLFDDGQLSVILRAIEQDSITDILQAPSVTVTDGQQAYITIRNEIRPITDLQPDVSDGVRQVDPLIPNIVTGPSLSIQPVVSADRRFITLELRPTVSVILNTPDIQAQNGEQQVPIDLPLIRQSNIRTTVVVDSGQTVVLGGLIQSDNSRTESVLPFFGNVPIIGRLFENRRFVKSETELLILVTPRIVE